MPINNIARFSLLTLFALTACSRTTGESNPLNTVSTSSANRDVVLRFHEALNKQDWSALDSMVTPDYRHYVVADTGFRALEWSDVRRGNAAVRAAFPDWTNTPVQVVSEGTHVAVLLLGRATHRGSMAGETPTGERVAMPMMLLHEVRGGRIAADWEFADSGPMMQRLSTPKR